MPGIEVQGVSPEDMIRELQESLRLSKENKYAFQVGLKDVDFDVDQEKIAGLGTCANYINYLSKIYTPSKSFSLRIIGL